jgi:hypothetical protein
MSKIIMSGLDDEQAQVVRLPCAHVRAVLYFESSHATQLDPETITGEGKAFKVPTMYQVS